jgi:hypothetical protein
MRLAIKQSMNIQVDYKCCIIVFYFFKNYKLRFIMGLWGIMGSYKEL